MKGKRNLLVIAGVLLLTELAFGALPEYEIIDLGTLGGSPSYPLGINDAGQVVGTSWTADEQVHGFLWDDVNGMTDMTELLDDSSDCDYIQSAIAINNNGQIICRPYPMHLPQDIGPMPKYSLKSSLLMGERHFLWDSETGFAELTGFGGLGNMMGESSIRAINDSTQIVGKAIQGLSGLHSPSPSPLPLPSYLFSHASLWDSVNGMTDLGTLGGRESFAFNINESGIVVGASATGIRYENGIDEARAFLWDSDNGMVDLGTLNSNDSSAWAINNFDKVVGASVMEEPDRNLRTMGINHAFVWSETDGMVDIHDSSYHSSVALGINDADQVVGIVFDNMHIYHLRGLIGIMSFPSPNHGFAFLWDKSYGMVNLNDLLPEDSGWDYLGSTKGINNKGQIIGTGIINGQMHAFLLSPVPPIPADVAIEPKTLNLSGRGKWISCRIWLPEDYDVADVNTNSILLEGQIAAAQVWVNEGKQVVMTKFSRADVQDILEAGVVELTISGELVDGSIFEGTDTIRVK